MQYMFLSRNGIVLFVSKEKEQKRKAETENRDRGTEREKKITNCKHFWFILLFLCNFLKYTINDSQ